MKLGIFAKTFAGSDPAAVLRQVRQAGFSTAQYNMACSGLPPMPDAIGADAVAAIATASAHSAVEICAMSGTYNMIHPDPEARKRGHRGLKILAAASASIPTRLITLCTGTRDPDDQWRGHPDNASTAAWDDLLESMATAIAIADRHDVDLGIEPELANVIDSAAKARRLIDTLASPRLKIVLDPANLFEVASLADQRDIVAAAIDLLGDRIALAHAKDRAPDGAFTTAGAGVLDYPHYLARLKSVGFDGPLVTHGLGADEAPGVAAFLRQAMDDAGVEVAP